MPYEEAIAARVRRLLEREGASERKMMGGIVFLVAGSIACGVDRDDLIVRVGREAEAAALARAHVRPMELSGRRTPGFVLVAKPGHARGSSLRAWVARGVAHARALSRGRRPVRQPGRPSRPGHRSGGTGGAQRRRR